MRNGCRSILTLAIGGTCLLVACAGSEPAKPAPTIINPSDISGRYVLIMGDAGMNAGSVGPLFTRRREADQVTLIGLPIAASTSTAQRWSTRVAQVRVGSSVLGPPGAISATPDGTRAYVCEPFKPVPENASGPLQPEPGDSITPIDLSDPAKPTALPPVRVGLAPVSVDVHPMGDFVAVGTAEPGQQIALLRVGTEAQSPLAFPLLGIDDERAEVGALAWHPTGRYLAVALPAREQVVIYEFARDRASGLPALAAWGDPVRMPARPAAIRFTPDGRHLLVTCVGRAAARTLPASDLGLLQVIRLSTVPSETTAAKNALGVAVSHATTDSQILGQMPEALAVSPDGVTVAIASWRGAVLFAGAKRAEGGEIRLFTLNAGTGKLAALTQQPARGIPTGISFDTRGEHLLVAQLRALDPTAIDGELTFFRVVRSSAGVTLAEADFAVGVGAGPHGNLIVR